MLNIMTTFRQPVFWVNCFKLAPVPKLGFFFKLLISNIKTSVSSEIDTEHDEDKQTALNPTHF